MTFTGKTVLVTGASRGIGRAVARQFAEAGASVAVHYHRDKPAAEATLASLPAGSHDVLQADVADAGECRDLVAATVDRLGGLDVLVNNAGIFAPHKVLEVDFEHWNESWEATLATNLRGPANLMYFAARHMVGNGGGRIVNVSSRGAFRGEPDSPAYGASKAGLNALSQSMALALAPHGVFVGVVAPGWVHTDMAAEHLAGASGDAIRGQSPLNRVADPDEIARAITFLASEGTEFLTGCILDANGASYLRT